MARRVVDLSLPISPADARGTCRFEPYKTYERDRARITLVTFDTHLGTHLDAPSHQLPDAPTLDQVDLAKCIGPAQLLDLRHKGPRQMINVDDLLPHADRIVAGSRVVLWTDWSRFFGEPGYADGYPALVVPAAEFFAERGVALVGVDTPSVAPVYQGMAVVNAVHEPLLAAGVVLVEGLANLAALRTRQFELVALPLSLSQLDGCPVRAVGVEDSEARNRGRTD